MAVNVRPLSLHAQRFYAEAREAYVTARSVPLTGPELQAAMDRAITSLEAAIQNSETLPDRYACPLFRSRLAELYMEQGPDGYDKAYDLLVQSVDREQGVPEWIPGWIGLARWALRTTPWDRQKADDSRAYLDQAAECLSDLKERSKPQLSRIGPFQGLTSDPSEDEDDPTPPESTRLNLLWGWMLANEQWYDDGFLHVKGMGAMMDPGAQMNGLERRIKAHVAYQSAAILIQLREPASVARMNLDAALAWDPNHFDATVEMAGQFRQTGEYQQAERLIFRYLEDPQTNVIFRNNSRLQFELARIYADWYRSSPRADLFDAADKSFRNLLGSVDELHGPGWLAYGQLLTCASRHEKQRGLKIRQRMVEDAAKYAENASRAGIAREEVESLRRDIEKAREDLDPVEPDNGR